MKGIKFPSWIIFANGQECMIANHKEKQEWQGRGKRKKPKVK